MSLVEVIDYVRARDLDKPMEMSVSCERYRIVCREPPCEHSRYSVICKEPLCEHNAGDLLAGNLWNPDVENMTIKEHTRAGYK